MKLGAAVELSYEHGKREQRREHFEGRFWFNAFNATSNNHKTLFEYVTLQNKH